jgi:hypothetical protein
MTTFVGANAQLITYSSPAQNVTRGLDSTLLTVRIDFPTTTAGSTVTISLGAAGAPGVIQYIPGSITKTGGTGSLTITESSIANLQVPVFAVPVTSAGQFIIFTLKRRANCGTASATKDNIVVTSSAPTFSETDINTNTYNLFAPALTIVPAPALANVNVGTAYNRNIDVTNGGNGCLDTLGFWIKYPTGTLVLNSLKIGATTLTPVFQNADSAYFRIAGTILSADKLLCNGETVVFTENVTALKCNATTTYGAEWYPHTSNTVSCQTATAPVGMTMSNNVPNLSASLTTAAPFDYCFSNGETKIQTVRITNSGAGPASNVELTLRTQIPGSYYGWVYFDTTIAWVVKNSAGTPIGVVNGFNTYIPATAFNTNCSQPATGLFTDLSGNLTSSIIVPAGDYVTVEVITRPYYFACGISCQDAFGFVGIQSQLDYKNQCGTGNYTEQFKNLAVRAYTYYSYAVENPSDINGYPADSLFNIDVFFTYWMNRNNPNGTGTTRFAIPLAGTGLRPTTTSVTLDTYTLPLAVINDTLFITFPQNTPSLLTGKNMRIPMRADCTTGGGGRTLQIFVLNQYANCSPIYKMSCRTTGITIHCPTPCPKGGATPVKFTLKRINVGLPDNDNDGAPDASGVVNLANILDHHSVNGDTLQGTWNIKVFSNVLSTANGYATTDPNYGGNISYVYVDFRVAKRFYYNNIPDYLKELPGAEVTIYPNGGGAPITCSINPTRIGDTVAHYEMSTACRGGFWQGGDSIVVKAKYTVNAYNSDNAAAVFPGYKNVAFTGFDLLITNNEVYSTYTQKTTNNTAPIEGQTYTCDHYNDYNQISYIWISNYLPSGQVINGCTNLLQARVRQYTRNQEGAFIFPNEYRNFYIPDEMRVIIPSGFTYRANTAKFNNVATAPISNANVSQVGDTLIFSGLKNFFTPYGGTLVPGDETTDHGVFFTIDPTCAAVPGSFFGGTGTIGIGNGLNTPASNYYQVQTNLQRSIPRAYSTGGVYNYAAPQPAVSGGATVLSTDGTADWNVVLQNISNSVAADNSWFYITSPPGVTNIVVKEGATVITPNINGFYQLGNLASSANRTFTVSAKTAGCAKDSIIVYEGYNCNAYPTVFALQSCTKQTTLIIDNYASQIQLSVAKQPVVLPATSVPLCSVNTTEFVINSALAGFANDPVFQVSAPTGLTITLAEIEYPLGSGNWSTSTPSGSPATYRISAHPVVISTWGTRGLPGTVDNPTPNERQAKLRLTFITDCNFASGSKIQVRQRANRPCGGFIPTTLGYNNIVRTDPITITGAGGTGAVSIATSLSPIIAACNNVTVNGSITPLFSGTTSSDTAIVTIPDAFSYQGGFTSTGLLTVVPGYPQAGVGGTTILRLKIPAGAAVGTPLLYQFNVKADPTSGCGFFPIEQSVERSYAPLSCGASVCPNPSKAIIGTEIKDVEIEKIKIGNPMTLTLLSNINTFKPGGTATLRLTLSNISALIPIPASTLKVQFYCGVGVAYNSASPITGTLTFNPAVAVGGTAFQDYTILIPIAPDCVPNLNVTAVIAPSTANCICDTVTATTTQVLPVNFESFTAKPSGTAAQLNWKASNDQIAKQYEVEQSADGNTYKSLAIIPSTNAGAYSYLHTTPSINNYYRIKALDVNGKTNYSVIRQVNFVKGSGGISIFPNPAKTGISLKVPEDLWYKNATVVIFAADGKLIMNTNYKNINPTEPINIAQLASGVYNVIVRTEGETYNTKLIVSK